MLGASSLVSLLIYLLIGALIVYVVNLILGMVALPPPVKTIALLIVALVVLVWLLRTFGFI